MHLARIKNTKVWEKDNLVNILVMDDMHGLVNETGYDVYKMEVDTGVCASGYAWVSRYGDVFFECTSVDLLIV